MLKRFFLALAMSGVSHPPVCLTSTPMSNCISHFIRNQQQSISIRHAKHYGIATWEDQKVFKVGDKEKTSCNDLQFPAVCKQSQLAC